MHRKIVFNGSVVTRDLSRADGEALLEAFTILQDLADRGVVEFRRNAGRTVGVGRKPASFLTPQGLEVLRYGLGKGEFSVTDLRAATGINKNSLAALLHGLAGTGHLRREPAPTADGGGMPGKGPKWVYVLTPEGRDAAVGAVEEPSPEEPSGPGVGRP